MEINVNSNGLNGFGDFGIGKDAKEAVRTDAARETGGASKTSLSAANLSISTKVSAMADAEPVANIPDAALTRDDALGKAVKAAFNLPPPPMPVFAD